MFVSAGVEAMSQELKRELTQCQVALADCRLEKDEVVNELTRLHEKFANCNTAEYSRECELKILALNEQLETMSGLLAHEREARLLESDSRIRAIEAEKAKENEFQLQIERLQKELLEKCNEIGELHEKVTEANEEKERFRTAAEQSFAFQEAASAREKELMNDVHQEEVKRNQVESRCVELLQIKIGLERDVVRLRNEVISLTEAEKEAREEAREKKQMYVVVTKRCDATVRQIHEDRKEALNQLSLRFQREKEENEEKEKELKNQIDVLEKEKQEEKEAGMARLEEVKREKEKEIQEMTEKIKRMKEEYETFIQKMKNDNEETIRQIQEKNESLMSVREKGLRSQCQQDTSAQLSRQKKELETEAEKIRSALEMKLVKAKEAALTEQTRVFQAELEKCQRENEERNKELERRLMTEKESVVKEKEKMIKEMEKNSKEKVEELEKEVSRLNHRIDDLLGAIVAKDEAMKHLTEEKQLLEQNGVVKTEGISEDKRIVELEARVKVLENEKKRSEEEMEAIRIERDDAMKRE